MKAEIIVGVAMAIGGISAALFGNPGHLIVSTLPGAALALTAYFEHRRDKKRAEKYVNHYPLSNNH